MQTRFHSACEAVYQLLASRYAYLLRLVASLDDPACVKQTLKAMETEINACQPSNEAERHLHSFVGWAFSPGQPSAAFRMGRPAFLLWLGTLGIEVGLGIRGRVHLSVDDKGLVRLAPGELAPSLAATPAFDLGLGFGFDTPAPAPAVKAGFGVSGGLAGEARRRGDRGDRRSRESRGNRGGRGGRSWQALSLPAGGPEALSLPAGGPEAQFNWEAALRSCDELALAHDRADPYGLVGEGAVGEGSVGAAAGKAAGMAGAGAATAEAGTAGAGEKLGSWGGAE